ncbi:hypothetical protein [Saccharopolyspora griseoalba]|uniref:Uncharacterized protein n=1 Tax=Saccharopolyspora griseoalba TaxID=1431848 RepID=A0ABW2LSK6_9PSEU
MLIAHGEFSVTIVGLVAARGGPIGPLATAYALVLAISGALITRWWGRPAPG